MIIGFNRGAVANVHLSGSLTTDHHLFIGRNNACSSLELSGSIISSSLVQLSQYDSPDDTISQLNIIGGSLKAQSLKLIHDKASVTNSGSITVDQLHLGGDNGEATFTTGGEVTIKELFLGGGDGKAIFVHNRGVVRIEKLHRNGGDYQMNFGPAELWIKMPADELLDFLPDIPRSTHGEWTLISETQ